MPTNLIPIVRSLWRDVSQIEQRLTLTIGKEPLLARIVQLPLTGEEPSLTWAWEVHFGRVPEGGYEEDENEACLAAEKVVMRKLKVAKHSWRKAA